MRRLRALFLAVPVLFAAPAMAQYAQPYDDPRFAQPPWAGEQRVAAAAQQLSAHTARLHRTVLRAEGYSQLADDTLRLARTAQRFQQMVGAPAPYPRVMAAFEELQRDYHALRGAFFRAHRTHQFAGVVNEWTRLATSFERLALSLGVEDDQLCVVDPRGGRSAYRDDYYGPPYDPRLAPPQDRFGRSTQPPLRFRIP